MVGTAVDVRLNEILAALSLACDVGNDFPMEKGLRNTLLAVRLASELGVRGEALSAVYYVGLLRFIGCSGYADETSRIFPDDNAMRGAMAPVDFGYPVEGLRQAARLGRGALGRTRAIATMVVRGKRLGEELQRSDCEVMIRGAQRLGLPAVVAKGLGDAYERWDGKGGPRGVRAEAIEMSARILAVTHQAEIHFRIAGPTAARAMIQRGAGGWFDPEIAETLLKHADGLLAPLTASSVWDAVLGEEPFPHVYVTVSRLQDIARLFGEIADLKCAYTLGHSIGVADLAAGAAARLAFADADVEVIRTAGLLHDIGRLSVPTGIWNKPGRLSPSEWDRVRLHTYYTERTLSQSPLLAPAARVASMHHERLDGSGYHRGVPASMLSLPARILAAADVYRALTEHRPHRSALDESAAASELQCAAERGALDRQAIRAVCEAAGHRIKKRAGGWPAGLSDREVEVLRHLARGCSEKKIGELLFISPGTVHTHVVHVYEKIGVSTRAAAALFAMEHDLLAQ
jgi:HD-GYP domain-containing protein (c-di-GMP phosphodiesterase class II)/DNA-binding CsgD family transcriptional regulator